MFVTSPKLSAIPGIRHAFFTREGGVSEGIYASLNSGLGSNDPADNIAENRRRMAQSLRLTPDRLIGCYQVHSPDVIIADAPYDGGERPKADGVATRLPGLACCASAADCGPVLFADPVAKVVAAAHAGWKGAIGGVLETAIARIEELGGKRSRVIAAIGPLIRQQSYEVGDDFKAQFVARDGAYAAFFIPSLKAGHAMFDLPGFIAFRLTQAGIGEIDDLGLDTYSNEALFYSYRRTTHRKEGDYGRHIAAIVLDQTA